MQIVFLVMIVFAGNDLRAVEINAWHIYADELGVAASCAEAIEDRQFQQRMAARLRPGERGSLQCRADEQMNALRFLLNPEAVQIQAVEPAPPQTQPADDPAP